MADAYADVLIHWSDEERRALHATLARLREDFARAAEPAAAAA